MALLPASGRRWIAGAAGLAACLWLAAEATACTLSVTDITSTDWVGGNGRGYEVYDAHRRVQLVTFRLRSHDSDCPFVLTVTPATTTGDGTGALLGPGATLSYELFKDASGSERLRSVGSATENEVFTGIAPGGRSGLALQFVVILPPEQLVPPGHYSNEIEFSAYEGSLASGVLRDRRRVRLTASVPSVAAISFAAGAAFDPNQNTHSLNFGNLRAGDRRVVQLKARGNGGYRLQLGSHNRGRLRHVDAGDDSIVSYSLTVDGVPVDLARGPDVEVAAEADLVPAAGRTHVLEFTVGEIGDATAGDYRDVINVTVLGLR